MLSPSTAESFESGHERNVSNIPAWIRFQWVSFIFQQEDAASPTQLPLKWVSSLPPYKYAWELLSFGIQLARALCDSLCSCAWIIGIGKRLRYMCLFLSEVCVFVCTEGLWDQVLRSIAAAGKLKCHYWFPAALGAKAVCGWLSDNLAWLMRARSRARAAETSRRSNTCSRVANKQNMSTSVPKIAFRQELSWII